MLEKFPRLTQDAFEAQGALAFLLARAGASSAIALSPSFDPSLRGAGIVNTPLAFDFSHSDHYGTQSVMWARVLAVVDGLIDLLKNKNINNNPTKNKL